MAEIKTLPMVLRTCALFDHHSALFLLDFLITEKQVSVHITTKQAICVENGQSIAMTNIPSGNAGIKILKGLKTCMLFKITDPSQIQEMTSPKKPGN